MPFEYKYIYRLILLFFLSFLKIFARNVMLLGPLVCVCVCDNSKSNEWTFTKFFTWVRPGQRMKQLNSGKHLDHILETKKNPKFLMILAFWWIFHVGKDWPMK